MDCNCTTKIVYKYMFMSMYMLSSRGKYVALSMIHACCDEPAENLATDCCRQKSKLVLRQRATVTQKLEELGFTEKEHR